MNFVRTSALAIATVAVLLVPTAAEAANSHHTDTSGDVSKVLYSTGGVAQTTDPTRAEGDILSTATVHGARRVTMAVRYRELSQTGHGLVHGFRIGTNKGRVREVLLTAEPGHWQGKKSFLNGKENRVGCKGVRWSIDYDADLVRASVPRRCLGNPKWVHVGIGSASDTPSDHTSTVFFDDANTDGEIGTQPEWGPRVYR